LSPKLFWDRFEEKLTPEIEIERAINFGGFDYIKEVQRKYGMEKFMHVLMTCRNLRKSGGQLLVFGAWP